MRFRTSIAASTLFVAVAAVATYLGPGGGASAPVEAIGSLAKPYVLSTPLFTPKDGSNSTLVFASMEDSSVVVNLRRYNAVGGLLSSTNVTIGAKSSIIAFAGANSGAQMHIEIWSPTPFFTMELTFTTPASVVDKIPYGDMLKPRTGTGLMALDPFRACDTRASGPNCPQGSIGPGEEISVQVNGVGGIPSVGVSAVVVNLQLVGSTVSGNLKVWPDGSAKPAATALLYEVGDRLSNMITVKVGTNGRIRVANAAGESHVVLDLAGYYI